MKVGFIGGGKMAQAIIADLVKTQTVVPGDIHVCDIDEACRRVLKQQHNINVSDESGGVLSATDIVFLAVKPQNLDEVLKEIAPAVRPEHLLISIAAGKRLAGIESLLPAARVIRVMPNLAALVSEGMSAFCAGERATPEDRKTTATLLSCFGNVLELPEKQFDAVTALSGSGPAFYARFHQHMVDGAVSLGLAREDAELLSAQTMLGTATLLTTGTLCAEDLIAAVSSKKGTTVAGLAVLNNSSLQDVVSGTLKAAATRSEELSR